MTPKHKAICDALLESGYEIDEILPNMGKTVLRKDISSVPGFTQWEYVTVLRNGMLHN